MAIDLDGTNDAYTIDSSVLGLNAGTIGAWFEPDFGTAPGVFIEFFDSDTARHAFFVHSTLDLVQMFNDGRQTNYDVAGLWSANDSVHFMFAYNKTGNVQEVYINGVLPSVDSVTGTWGSSSLGTNAHICQRFSANTRFDGGIAEFFISTAVLGVIHARQLAAGYSPPRVVPDLTAYMPFSNIDRITNYYGVNPVVVGTPANATHPRVIYGRKSGLISPPVVFELASTLAASGDLTALGALQTDQAGTLAAALDLISATDLVLEGDTTLASSYDITSLGSVLTEQSATLAVSMNLTAAAALALDVNTTLAASSNIISGSDITLEASALLGASINLAAAVDLIAEVDGALAASSNLVAASDLLSQVSATLATSTELAALGDLGGIDVSASLVASFQVTTALEFIAEALATLDYSADLSSSQISNMIVSAGLAVSVELTPITALQTDVAASILWSADIGASESVIVTGLTTPDGRKIVILADTRTVTVLE